MKHIKEIKRLYGYDVDSHGLDLKPISTACWDDTDNVDFVDFIKLREESLMKSPCKYESFKMSEELKIKYKEAIERYKSSEMIDNVSEYQDPRTGVNLIFVNGELYTS